MTVQFKTLMKATVALSSLCVSAQAFAQDAAASQRAAGDVDIIVTARRIEERLQNVPISIVTVSQDQLTKANITSADDLVKVVPGLNVESRYSSETNAFAVRGFN
jgi:iron complex outermembrane receptor protein